MGADSAGQSEGTPNLGGVGAIPASAITPLFGEIQREAIFFAEKSNFFFTASDSVDTNSHVMNKYPSIANVPTTATRIVHMARGSWKYQDRYQISHYTMHRTKAGKWVWQSTGFVARGQGVGFAATRKTEHLFRKYSVGSLHNQPVCK